VSAPPPRLVLRFDDPRAGQVLLDGHDVRELDWDSLRGSTGYVAQDVFVFAGSAADNIRYGRPGATLQDVREAARAAAALEFIDAYDRWRSRVLYVLPVLVAVAVGLVFTRDLALVLVGVAAWAAATGVQDSTVKALVADLVPPRRLATADGVFAAVQGGAALAGAGVAGGLYEHYLDGLVVTLVGAQLLGAGLLVRVLHWRRD
jgi:MFS family permease